MKSTWNKNFSIHTSTSIGFTTMPVPIMYCLWLSGYKNWAAATHPIGCVEPKIITWMPPVATWMDLETTRLSEARQWKTNIIWEHLHVNLKKKKGYKGTDLQNRNRLTDFESLQLPKGTGEGLGLASAVYARIWSIWNDWPVGTRCTAQRILPSILWSSTWEKNSRK